MKTLLTELTTREPSVRKRCWRLALRPPFSLQTRLMAAFVVLILTSASATIAIGGVIYARTLRDLVVSKMVVGLRVAELGLAAAMQRLEQLARAEVLRAPAGSPLEDLCTGPLARETALDAALLLSPEGASAALFTRSMECRDRRQVSRGALPEALRDLHQSVLALKKPVSGFIVLDRPELQSLGMTQRLERGLLLAAAAPAGTDGALVLLTVANERSELLADAARALGAEGGMSYAVTLYLDETPIASTFEHALGAQLEPAILDRVLSGATYVGMAGAVEGREFAAYRSLQDSKGRAVGMLGTAVSEGVLAKVRNKTIGLFAALIALGALVGVAMTYWFTRLLIRPVRDLAVGMGRVAHGDLSYKVRIQAADELGRLAKAFNLMVKNIQERDIRLRELTEERLTRVDKQVSIGRLAAGVAHEINNPLTSILSLSILVMKSLPAEDRRREDLGIVVQETTRCRDIVRNLLDFAREGQGDARVVDINQVLRDTMMLVSRYDQMEHVRTELRLLPVPLYVNADPKQLQQVFTNLIANGAEAMNDHGTITIATDEDSSGAYVVARVSDTGRGIPRENLPRVFEPFFTTKETGKGTGLGLSISMGIVRKHNGSIDVESEVGRGTTVTILLPRVDVEMLEGSA